MGEERDAEWKRAEETKRGKLEFSGGGKVSLAQGRRRALAFVCPQRRSSQKGAPPQERRAVGTGCAFEGEEGGGARRRGQEELAGDWWSVTSPGGQPRGGEASQGGPRGRETR